MKTNIRKLCHIFAYGFGAGLIPFAPGTWGTLVGIPFVLALQYVSMPVYGVILLGLFLIGVVFCDVTERDLQRSDPGCIVWDEIVGFILTCWFIPITWWTLLLAFLLFRFFDIVKPWPIRYLDQHIPGGFGIMIDDVLAGIYAGIVAYVVVSLNV